MLKEATLITKIQVQLPGIYLYNIFALSNCPDKNLVMSKKTVSLQ